MCGAEKQSQRVCTHEEVVRRSKSQWTTDFCQNSGTHIVYNSHVTCSNSSFSLTMVTPKPHFFAFRWLCCLFPIGYLPKPTSVGRCSATITEFNHVHRSRWYSDNHFVDIIFSQMQLSQHPPIHSTAPVGMRTFRWSLRSYQCICQQHPLYSHLQITLIYYKSQEEDWLQQPETILTTQGQTEQK